MKKKILHFREINEFFEYTGFEKRTDISDFYIFSFEELSQSSSFQMPPYQKDFYQIALIQKSDYSSLAINQQEKETPWNTLYFLSPEHVFSWKRDKVTQGYIVYFKSSFLSFYKGSIERDFPFFEIIEKNIHDLTAPQSETIVKDFINIYGEFYNSGVYRTQIIQSVLLSLLFRCKTLHKTQSENQPCLSKNKELLFKFKNLVNNLFLKDKQVKDYAEKLFVTSNYLTEAVKELTGKTAKEMITDRVIQEAKNQLQYSNNNISEIAFFLGFEEPTHFIRFFKLNTEQTPNEFRSAHK